MSNEKVVSKPVFDESKNYAWKPEDEFALSGNEFGFLYQVIKAEIDGVGIPIKTKLAQYDLIRGLLEAAVEKGIATELPLPINEAEYPPETAAKAN